MRAIRTHFRLWQELLTDRRFLQPTIILLVILLCSLSFATGPDPNNQETNNENGTGCDNGCGEVTCPCESSSEATDKPILLWRGAVLENSVDLYLPGIGAPFMHSRTYSSMSGAADGSDQERVWIQGNRWAGGLVSRMLVNTDPDIADANDPDDIDLLLDAAEKRSFTRRGSTDFFDSADSTYVSIRHNTTDKTYEVFNRHSDTIWIYYDFDATHAAGKQGLLKARTDRTGNTTDYTYGGSGDESNRLSSVTTSQGWEVDYLYEVGTANIGKIRRVDVKDAASGGNVMQRVRYTYAGDANLTVHSDISGNATDGDLLLVEVFAMGSDPSKWSATPADADFATSRVLMYRYEAGSRIKAVWEPDAAERATDEIGAVTDPVDLLNQSDAAVNPYRSRSFTYYTGDTATTAIATPWDSGANENLNTTYGLDERAETETAGSGVTEETLYRVKTETVYTGLGGVTKTYFYLQHTANSSGDADEVRWVTIEDTEDASSSERYRMIYGMNDEGILLRQVFIDTPTSSPRYWCTSYLRGTSGFAMDRVLETRLPSAHTEVDTSAELIKFLDPTTATNDADTVNNTSGRVLVTDYEDATYDDADGTFTMSRGVKEGENGSVHWLGYQKFQKFDGTGDDAYPRFLPVESYAEPDFGTTDKPVPQSETAGAGEYKPEADDVTTIAYTFHDTDDQQQVKTRTVTLPAAEVSENGSDVRTAMRTYLDTLGRPRWVKDGEGHVSYLSYSPDMGRLAYVMQDVDTDNLPGDITNGDNQGGGGEDIYWEAWSATLPAEFANTDNDNEQLVTKSQYDDLGRPRKLEDAEGTVTYITYGVNETRIYAAWDDPSDKPLLPIVVTKTDDAGRVVESFALDPAGVTLGLSDGDPTGVDTGVTQADYLAWSKRSFNDYFQLESVDRYHDIPASGDGTAGTNYYRDRFTFDDEGRLAYAITHVSGTTPASAVEQVTKTEYDRLSRPIRVYRGLSGTGHNADTGGDPADFPLIGMVFYDSATTVAPSSNPEADSGVGDSLVTARIGFYEYDDANDETDTDYYLKSVYHRNWRAQLRGIEVRARRGAGDAEGPETPFLVRDVDNLGRTRASVVYDASLTWSTVVGDADYAEAVATDRRTLAVNHFDLLNQLYQTEAYEVQASDGATTHKIVSDYFFNRNGQMVAGTTSGGGAVELAYDGALRLFQTRSLTELESAGANGRYDANGAFNYRDPLPKPGTSGGTIAYSGGGGEDKVLAIHHRVLDGVGNVLESITLEADQADTNGLNLAAATKDFVQSATHRYFDDAHRLTETVNYGTNTETFVYAALPARPASAPAGSDTVLITGYEYDAASRLLETTDAEDTASRRGYDDLSRLVYSVSNYNNFNFDTEANTGGGTGNNEDQVTKRVFNALNQVTQLTALDRNGDGNLADNQTTTYTYGDDLLAFVLTEIKFPDSTGAADVVAMTYQLDGRLDTRTDQRGNVITHAYDELRRLEARTVTTLGTDTDSTVRAITYSRDDLGLLTKVTTHGNATADPDDTTNILNQIAYTYHDHLGLHKERQDHDSPVDAVGGLATQEVAYHYDTTNAAGVFTKGLRHAYTVYPDARQIHTTYGTSGGIDDLLSRAAGLANQSTTTANTPGDAIATYTYMGSGRLAKKLLDIPGVALDRITPQADGTTPDQGLAGLDRFGRITNHTWIDTHGTGATSDDTETLNIAHGYDRVHRMLYADRKIYPSLSQAYQYDDLHRLDGFSIGNLERDGSGDVELDGTTGFAATTDLWTIISEDHDLDLLHNAATIDDDTTTEKIEQAVNDANEITQLDTRRGVGAVDKNIPFSSSSDKELFEAGPEMSGTQFTNNVASDNGGNDLLTIGLDSGQGQAGILSKVEYGAMPTLLRLKTPPGYSGSGQAGYMFGHKSDLDFWLWVKDFGDGDWKLYHVHDDNGDLSIDYSDPDEKELILTKSRTGTTADTFYSLWMRAASNAVDLLDFSTNLTPEGGFPSGRWGLYTEIDGVAFGYMLLDTKAFPREIASAWETWSENRFTSLGGTEGVMTLGANYHNQTGPLLPRCVAADRFRVTFSMKRNASFTYARIRFAFNFENIGEHDTLQLDHDNASGTPTAPLAFETNAGLPQQVVPASAGRIHANVPDPATADTKVWYRIESDGTDVTVYAATSEAGLSSASPCFQTSTATERFDFSAGGGRLGFLADQGVAYLDDLTIKTDRDNNGSYETTEHIEDFQANGSYYEDELDHDAAGNLTFDGHLKYTYDAFNRLTQAQKAYRDSGGTLQTGSTIAEYEYDGQHRRIAREITNSGQLDAIYHYYCAGASVIEEHVGTSATVIKQHVWGLTYIDELIETTVDGTPYYAVLDSKYCVLALLESDGDIKGRYEYTPQGERQVFITSGANDPKAQTPMTQAPRAGTAKAYALCDIGFQGLMHDEVTGNIYQRAREYSPRLARFLQRDPLGYPDGLNSYVAYHVLRGGLDPWGLDDLQELIDRIQLLDSLHERFSNRLADRNFQLSNDNRMQMARVSAAISAEQCRLEREFEDEAGITIDEALERMSATVAQLESIHEAFADAPRTYEELQRSAQLWIDGVGPEVEVPEWIQNIASGAEEGAEFLGNVRGIIDKIAHAKDILDGLNADACPGDTLAALASILEVVDYLPLPKPIKEIVGAYADYLTAAGDALDYIENTDPNGANEFFWLKGRDDDIGRADGRAPRPGQFLGNDWADDVLQRQTGRTPWYATPFLD
ncbi:MAG: RHS repeat-associated core domain-containing protein [Planctomycetota bacterium]